MKFSSGNWRFQPKYASSALVEILNDEGETVDACIECHSAAGGRAEDEANARLVAGAPNMLKALVAMINEKDGISALPRGEALILARAAVASVKESQ